MLRASVAIIRDGELVTVETIAGLLDRKVRRLTLTFTVPVDAAPFAALPGVGDVRRDGSTVMLTMHDGKQLDAIVKLAGRHTLADPRIEHPSLEENFPGFYTAHDAPLGGDGRGEEQVRA